MQSALYQLVAAIQVVIGIGMAAEGKWEVGGVIAIAAVAMAILAVATAKNVTK